MFVLTEDEVKDIELSILCKVDSICREYGLSYFLHAGTLLGAVRHHGFIPWDDDIDISMKRDDFDKLRHIVNSTRDDISFLFYDDNPDTIFPFGKICDTSTKVEETNFRDVHGYGVFIDVFPLDYLPNNAIARYIVCRYFTLFSKIITHSSRISFDKTETFSRNLLRLVAFNVCKHLPTYKMIRAFDAELRRICKLPTQYIGVAWGNYYPSNCFDTNDYASFEEHIFMIPKDYDTVLTCAFGDYMKLPPENERVAKHGLICYRK